MHSLGLIDFLIFIAYFAALLIIGLYAKKAASAGIEHYFLGGRNLPWWALGVSGMASFLDLTGTMIIVSFLYMLGPRGLYVEFRGGAVLVLAVMMLWTGKWHRRSGCITNAEWMIYRFGNTAGGHFARIAGAVATIVSSIGMIAYLIKGTGLFAAMFVPLSPQWCAIAMIGLATVYILLSGFYGVVYTDLFQSGIILFAIVIISAIAFLNISSERQIAELAQKVTGQPNWTSGWCHFQTPMPKGYEQYRFLFLISFFYLLRNVIFGMGAGGEPRYFGARSDRECGKLTCLWIFLMMFRWPMMMAFAVLGLFMVQDLFADQTVLSRATALIHSVVGPIDKSQWAEYLARIANQPQNFPEEFIQNLQNLLGDQWTTKVHLLSFEGGIDPERILPAVILYRIPNGLRGLILVALIAASLSTFGSIVNWTIGFFTRDFYQAYIRPKASIRELIYASWVFGLFFIIVCFVFAYWVKNINDIWDWFIMALGGGLVVPTILRFYWWRFNGGGFAIGTLVGLAGAVLLRIFQIVAPTDVPTLQLILNHPVWQFFTTIIIGLIGSIIGAYLTQPTERSVLEQFYRTTRPFGFWKPLEGVLPENLRYKTRREHFYDMVSLPFVLGWQITLFLLPMLLMVKNYQAFWTGLIVFLICLFGMWRFWAKNLPEEHTNLT